MDRLWADAECARTPGDLRALLAGVGGAWGEAEPEGGFDPSGPARRVLHESEAIAIVLIGWLPGQASEIHDHGGSQCGLRVLRGVATEQRYEADGDGRARLVSKDRYLAGSVLCCDGTDIHRLGNAPDASEPLVTLHVYRPRPVMRVYTAGEGAPA